MEYSVFLTEQAKSDLAEIYSYISVELKSKKSAENVISSLHQAMKALSLMPSRYHQFPNEPWISEGVRYFTVRNYSIFYTIDEKNLNVSIVHVIYGRRNLPQVLSSHK
ncbi:MAG: type II toxin-antitoxin system RelE/ParE family toxin [Fibrobacter sp.]|nr:type II toxin-antitoxin system RelE/ParE family toxin [Fibrobacter sp.]